MNKKELVEAIDKIVKIRVNEALKNDKVIKSFIKEEVKNQLIKVLLENKIQVNTSRSKKYSDITDLIEQEDVEENYPKLSNVKRNIVKKSVKYTNDPILNRMLNETPYVNDSYGDAGMTGNALMDMGSFSNESTNFAQSYAQSLGRNVKIDIDENALENVRNTIPQNAQFVTNKKTPQLKEYKGDDGFMYVSDDGLFDDDQISTEQLKKYNINNSLEKAFNKDYSQLLKKTEEKAKNRRPIL